MSVQECDGRVRAAGTAGRQEHSVPQQRRWNFHATCPKRRAFFSANGTYGLGVLTADLDNDGWPDIYVANDSTASALYQNKKNGKFQDIAIEAGCALSPDGKPQAGMGVSAADYDLDGNLDLVKTNFAGDTPSLYHNQGGANFEDATFTAGLGAHTQYLGWGCGFFDMDNDGWADILICNGHVYPEVEQLKTEAGYAQRKLLYQNLHNGHFADVSLQAGPGISEPSASRGAAFGDFDNDGDIDVVVNTVNDYPQLLRCDSKLDHNWIKIRTIGTKSNRSGIGARLVCVTHPPGETKPHRQIDEVRSGGGYFSQNDLRVHFGLGKGREGRRARGSLAQRAGRYAERCQGEPGDLREGRRRDYPHGAIREGFQRARQE